MVNSNREKGFFQTLLNYPKIKETVQWIKDLWTQIKKRPLTCLITGFAIGAFIFGYSIRKNILFRSWVTWLTEEYQETAGHLDRELPKQTDVKISSVTEEFERWLSAEVRWFEEEVNAEKKLGAIVDFAVKKVEWKSAFASPTQKFQWHLMASPGYSISGSAYRTHTTVHGRKLFESLKTRKDPQSPDSLTFLVPESEKGDTLFAIIALKGKDKQIPTNITLTFQSKIE